MLSVLWVSGSPGVTVPPTHPTSNAANGATARPRRTLPIIVRSFREANLVPPAPGMEQCLGQAVQLANRLKSWNFTKAFTIVGVAHGYAGTARNVAMTRR